MINTLLRHSEGKARQITSFRTRRPVVPTEHVIADPEAPASRPGTSRPRPLAVQHANKVLQLGARVAEAGRWPYRRTGEGGSQHSSPSLPPSPAAAAPLASKSSECTKTHPLPLGALEVLGEAGRRGGRLLSVVDSDRHRRRGLGGRGEVGHVGGGSRHVAFWLCGRAAKVRLGSGVCFRMEVIGTSDLTLFVPEKKNRKQKPRTLVASSLALLVHWLKK